VPQARRRNSEGGNPAMLPTNSARMGKDLAGLRRWHSL